MKVEAFELIARNIATQGHHVGVLGDFRLVMTTDAWRRRLMLGATDYYRERETSLRALQILPDRAHATIDIPDLAGPFESARNRPWRWVDDRWSYSIPERSVAMADRAVLCGAPATHAARWEEDQWEVFSTPPEDVDPATCRPVPIDVLLAADASLSIIVDLPVGTLVSREAPSEPFRSE